ncbi:hypothetical protein PAXINDRAFT_18692, partial [Paxillus involutus ATCC 200175]
PTSSQENVPGTHVDTPSPPPPTPSLPVEQTAPTSRRPTHQRSRNGHVPRNGTRRTREDDQGSRGEVKSRSRGGREPDDEDGDDDDVHHAQVEPQNPSSTRQTANEEATGTSNPNANGAGTTMPVGTSNGPSNASKSNGNDEEVKGKGGKGEGNERASGIAAPSSNGENAVPDSIPPTPNPDERGPPPSMPLEGEKGQQSSGHVDETGTHLKPPGHESKTTTHLIRTPYDKESSGEGRRMAMGHRESEGEEIEVGVREDDTNTSNGVDERQCQREEARDEARDDEEGRKVEERRIKEEGGRTAATNVNANGQYLSNDEGDLPPEPPPSHYPVPTPSSSPPERRDGDVDTAKSNKTPARRRADAVHDPGGETKKPPSVRLEGESSKRSSLHVETDDVETEDDDLKSSKTAARTRADALHDPGGQMNSPGSKPPSVGLEGERIRRSSLHVEADDVKTNDDRVENGHNTQQSPRRPVGTTDGDERRPNGPTEPPDEEEWADGRDGEVTGTSTIEKVESRVDPVENAESKSSRRGDEPRGREDEGVETREVEGEERGQSEGDGCQRDGRTIDTGDATSGTTPDSKRVEAGPLADDETSQQRNGRPNVSNHSPTPSTPSTKHTN